MKEQLIMQLKTQITDLERFINYLQGEVSTESLACTCACPIHTSGTAQNFNSQKKSQGNSADLESNASSLSNVRKIVALLHMYIMSQMGCTSQSQKTKKKDKIYSWRDLRTRLDIAVEHVLETVANSKFCNKDVTEDFNYYSDSDSVIPQYDVKIATAVRKHLAVCIRDLIQHGSTTDAVSTSVVPFVGCFAPKTNVSSSSLHAWEIILKYYEIKNGYHYNSSPFQKLSQSFNLDLNGKQNTSSKQVLKS